MCFDTPYKVKFKTKFRPLKISRPFLMLLHSHSALLKTAFQDANFLLAALTIKD